MLSPAVAGDFLLKSFGFVVCSAPERGRQKGKKMRLEKNVNFSLNTDLFYWWHKTEGGLEFRKSERKECFASGKFDDLMRQVKNWCAYICQDAKNNVDKKMYDISLSRYVFVTDRDSLLSFRFGDKVCKFILATDGNLIYPSDVRDSLRVPHYFDGVVFPEKMSAEQKALPVFVEEYNLYKAWVRPLNDSDIVVGPDFNQIWPLKGAGQVPVTIEKLLKKKNERIYTAK